MNKILMIVYCLVVAILGYALFEFSSSFKINRAEPSSIIHKDVTIFGSKRSKVDRIFSQVDSQMCRYNLRYTEFRKSDSKETKEAKTKFFRLRKELDALGEDAYPVIFEYISSDNFEYSHFASTFAHDLQQKAIVPLVVFIGKNDLPTKKLEKLEFIIGFEPAFDSQTLFGFLSSSNLKERRVAAKILAKKVADQLNRDQLLRSRSRSSSNSFSSKYVLAVQNQSKLLELVKSEQDEDIKIDLIKLLAAYGEENERIKEKLFKMLRLEKSVPVKASLADAIGYLASFETIKGAGETIKPLIKEIQNSKDTRLKQSIIRSLGRVSDKLTDNAVDVISNVGRSEVDILNQQVLQTLARAAITRKDCFPFVKQSLQQTNEDTVTSALRVIPHIKEGFDQFVPEILRLAKTKRFGSYACRALGEIGPPVRDQAAPVLRELANGRTKTQRYAARALEKM